VSELAFLLWEHKCVFYILENCVCVWEKIVWSRKYNYLCVKCCRRRISAVCVRKGNHWRVVKNSLVSTILACLLSVVIKCWVESAGSGLATGKMKVWVLWG